jgi:hypothetical protein
MAEKHIVNEDIDAVIRGGLAVHDANGEKIGIVRDYSNVAGYLVVQTGLIAHKELYVPYSAIQSIDPREVYLSLRKAALVGDYSAPPAATIVVEGDTAATVVPSGYDGSPAAFNRVNLELVRRDIARGMAVYATSGDKLGTVDGFDSHVGYLVVQGHHFGEKDFFIPFAAITAIDREDGEVFLAISKDVVLKDYAHLPDGTVLRIDAAAPGGKVISAIADEQPGEHQ